MKLLVTGGAGFIGSNFVRRSLGGTFPGIDSIIVLDKLTYAGIKENLLQVWEASNFEFIEGDITNFELLAGILPKVDAVVNFAAESHVDRSISNSTDFIDSNIVGVHTLLRAILETNKAIRFLQVSTDEIYGSIQKGTWDENSPTLPNSPYAASKASAEMLVRAFNRTFSIDTVITRCSNNYGPFHHPEKLIPNFVTNLLLGRKVTVYGNGQNIRDWLHVDDHCAAINMVLQHGQAGEIYNVGGGQEKTNLEITNLILKLMGKNEGEIEFVPDRLGHDFRYSVNWQKIKNELGYQPKVEFDEGIRSTIDWYKKNTYWWESLK